ncbi:mitochondrial genome maintenance protein MGM101 [bacterium]|nr:mitochondrial genome maintenance protein MGM101 [bacterium]
MGEAKYQPGKSRKSYASALEACKSNALMRCCKDIGVASECWDRKFTNQFKKEYCVAVWRDGYKDPESGKNRPCWRLRSDDPFFDETGVIEQRVTSRNSNVPKVEKSSSLNSPTPSTPTKILPAQIQAITSLCKAIGEDPDVWMRKTFARALEETSTEIAKKAIPMLNQLRSNSQGKGR